jgi:hypothetical protein
MPVGCALLCAFAWIFGPAFAQGTANQNRAAGGREVVGMGRAGFRPNVISGSKAFFTHGQIAFQNEDFLSDLVAMWWK